MRFLKKFHNRTSLQAALIILGAASLLFGIYREEAGTVLMKAIYICLECIGIG